MELINSITGTIQNIVKSILIKYFWKLRIGLKKILKL